MKVLSISLRSSDIYDHFVHFFVRQMAGRHALQHFEYPHGVVTGSKITAHPCPCVFAETTGVRAGRNRINSCPLGVAHRSFRTPGPESKYIDLLRRFSANTDKVEEMPGLSLAGLYLVKLRGRLRSKSCEDLVVQGSLLAS